MPGGRSVVRRTRRIILAMVWNAASRRTKMASQHKNHSQTLVRGMNLGKMFDCARPGRFEALCRPGRPDAGLLNTRTGTRPMSPAIRHGRDGRMRVS